MLISVEDVSRTDWFDPDPHNDCVYMSSIDALIRRVCHDGTSYAEYDSPFSLEGRWDSEVQPAVKDLERTPDPPDPDSWLDDDDADLLLISSDHKSFSAHSVILRKAS